MSTFTGLTLPSDELRAEIDSQLLPCDSFTTADIDDLDEILIPENDPENFLRRELQTRNDCQGNSITTCVEIIRKRIENVSEELSRTFAYQLSELLDGRGVGRDMGSSIYSGVKAATDIGFPTEQQYPYDSYVHGEAAFRARMTKTILDECAKRRIIRATPAPAWDVMLAHVALGHPLHWGTWWPLSLNSNNVATKYTGNHGDGGHAYAGVWPQKSSNGQWLLKMANSHGERFGRRGYFWITEQFYEEARNKQNTPFGAFLLYGAEHPLQAHYDAKKSDLMG